MGEENMLKERDNIIPDFRKHAMTLSEKMICIYDLADDMVDNISGVLIVGVLLLLIYYLVHIPSLALLVSDYVKN
ncbi:hypothetical protein SAMN02745975_01883 [Geosporobacter subterraneus DSM 17957]|uniref:Uncharacterized protein n=2 Tax=Geosporobacter TaxID=390805 RepID=A0A1M6IJ94_9FIRM|nr:hypothetical protein SAMN02745975_01883 [Geosporobacter subterraneus DSM 17957]